MSLQIVKITLLLLFLMRPYNTVTVSSADFTTNVFVPGSYAYGNNIGLSFYLNQTLDYMNNTLFKQYILNSKIFSSWSSVFYQSFHVPIGYKYNCNSSIYTTAVNLSCIIDLMTNNYTTHMQTYFFDATSTSSVDLGWDLQSANFSKSTYYSNFAKYQDIFSSDSVNLQLLDFGDKASSYLNRTYTVTNYLADLSTIDSKYFGLWMNGPGITQNADSSWVAQMQNIYNNYFSTFTFRCVLFKNISDATIANLMNQTYSKGYLLRRIVTSSGVPVDMSSIDVGINEIKMIEGVGIDGVTNSFAAALWALDIAMEMTVMYGNFINFYNPMDISYQSVLGSAPNFKQNSLYYGLLFGCIALNDGPDFQLPTIMQGSSQSIKIYGLSLYWTSSYRILIINKDMNESLSGTVDIKLSFKQGLSCIYLSAPHLNSTQNITIGGVYFTSNNSDYQGSYSTSVYQLNPVTNSYQINITYAQAIICDAIIPPSYTKFKRGQSKHGYESLSLLTVLTLLHLLL